MIIKLIKIIY